MTIELNYTNSIEVIRLTFIFGLILAFFLRRKTGFNAGGLIVPGFLALTLSYSFFFFLVSIIIAVLIYHTYRLTLEKKALTGRYPVLIKITLSVIFVELFGLLGINLKIAAPNDLGYIGYIVPGLIASTYRRHGDIKVFVSTIIASFVTFLFGVLIYNLVPDNTIFYLKKLIEQSKFQSYSMEGKYILFITSSIIALLAYHFGRYRIGGIVIAPLVIDLFTSSVYNALLFVSIVLLTYFIVVTMMKYTKLIGIERFVFATIIGIIFTWIFEIVLLNAKVNFPPLLLTTIFTPIAVGSYVNDITLQGVKKSILPVSITLIILYFLTLTLQFFKII